MNLQPIGHLKLILCQSHPVLVGESKTRLILEKTFSKGILNSYLFQRRSISESEPSSSEAGTGETPKRFSIFQYHHLQLIFECFANFGSTGQRLR